MSRERIDFHSVDRIYKMLDLILEFPQLNSFEIEKRFSTWDTKEKGVLAEVRAQRVLRRLPFVHDVSFSKKHEDNIDKVDLWVTLVKRVSQKNRNIPVQVKSSATGCKNAYEYFEANRLRTRKAPEFLRPVILNAGLKVTDRQIVDSFYCEIKTLVPIDLTSY